MKPPNGLRCWGHMLSSHVDPRRGHCMQVFPCVVIGGWSVGTHSFLICFKRNSLIVNNRTVSFINHFRELIFFIFTTRLSIEMI